MSQVFSKSPKHCAQLEEEEEETVLFKNLKHFKFVPKKLLCTFSSLFTSIIALILLLWLILHPSKPHFTLKDTDLYQLNLSAPHLLNSSIQLTLLTSNPNDKVGIYYDHLQAYASYKGQQITGDTTLPPFYQDHGETNLLTAYLVGAALPVAPSFDYQVERDRSAGKLVLVIKLNGKLRWKIGTWVSGQYRFNVNCVSVMPFGLALPPPLTSTVGTQCSTAL